MKLGLSNRFDLLLMVDVYHELSRPYEMLRISHRFKGWWKDSSR